MKGNIFIANQLFYISSYRYGYGYGYGICSIVYTPGPVPGDTESKEIFWLSWRWRQWEVRWQWEEVDWDV